MDTTGTGDTPPLITGTPRTTRPLITPPLITRLLFTMVTELTGLPEWASPTTRY
jgi:hypothetical protein